MLICNVPVKASHVHIIIIDWFRNLFMWAYAKHKNAKFNFVYFSYQPDFDYLYLSIKSLVNSQDKTTVRNIYVFIDQKSPFNESEINQLQELSNDIIFLPVFNFSWASTETTMAEISSFQQVMENAQNNDFIVKVDSDIVFFKNTKLTRLLTSKHIAVGDGHHLNYQYAQGGLYMFRKYIGEKVLGNMDEQTIIACEKQCDNKGEDKVLSTLFLNRKFPFYLTRLMIFPDEYSLLKEVNCFLRWEFCCGHFVKDKDNMKTYNKLFNE